MLSSFYTEDKPSLINDLFKNKFNSFLSKARNKNIIKSDLFKNKFSS